ncbi:tryptophan synthase subunit alpha [Achromobacter ruhlandii]|uniref:Tryptophan synthase alpha chain n=1 Tax=Achromobacter ruhlandii TaxID=72557 RepID=A0ABM8M2R8_9BURK|nr:tryptophan synthase subunit alpha [Achromobacter ruhlandii]AKP89995.1 Tryptophan synthase alpha chain [Achromobacter xylosoxidans]AOU93049.1 tryptophan synthase subunit alpha [Achromobacter ruhlandii]MCZ8432443.1 tryptophan synthase subunit alpha [Achromobacter ruhlandii]MDC6089496.1 tryptophan synthase subunit alpha [Achromobacter ruhlandii]MDC6148783.1 tryptophan synthase subunit alpha [Achromobacter ruhlandii]
MNRLERTLADLRAAGRAGLAAYFTAGDPSYDDCLALLRGLPAAGADVIELGMPFSDPIADGPVLQRANARALKAGQTQRRTLELVAAFREEDERTPVVLMGYLNPLMRYEAASFMADAAWAGVDGLIVVDLSPEHAAGIERLARRHGIAIIRMTAPTTPDERLERVLAGASGFVYHVMLAGTTGAALPADDAIARALARVRACTPLPIAAGFGVRTAEQARAVGRHADLVAVGTRLVETLAAGGIGAALAEVRLLASAARQAR